MRHLEPAGSEEGSWGAGRKDRWTARVPAARQGTKTMSHVGQEHRPRLPRRTWHESHEQTQRGERVRYNDKDPFPGSGRGKGSEEPHKPPCMPSRAFGKPIPENAHRRRMPTHSEPPAVAPLSTKQIHSQEKAARCRHWGDPEISARVGTQLSGGAASENQGLRPSNLKRGSKHLKSIQEEL